MRLYIIGVMVGVMGLLAVNQVRAEEGCGLRSDGVFKVAEWHVRKEALGLARISVQLVSQDPKPIRDVSGSVEFFSGGRNVTSLPIRLREPAKFSVGFLVEYLDRDKARVKRLAGAHVIACVAAITYTDGSGVIIN